MDLARDEENPLLIEATSNQVDQFGGYTGMTPLDFRHYVNRLAERQHLNRELLILGGDHLGPNRWQDEPAEEAMAKARDQIRAYVEAGFQKIHLDTSMRCADDPGDRHLPLNDRVVAHRAAQLCRVAEEAFERLPDSARPPLYVIGTEVPVPGGAQETLDELEVTSAEAARQTIEVTREEFHRLGLHQAWQRVVAVVVQPGVEFGDASVVEYQPERARSLSAVLKEFPGLVYEAHSTDYQPPDCLASLVKDRFAILKVGPWLTFAFREAVFALEKIEEEMLTGRKDRTASRLAKTLEKAMIANPKHWTKHYGGTEWEQTLARKYSYSDRCRYYWPDQEVQKALGRLWFNLESIPPPLTLVSQFLPDQYRAIRAGELSKDPKALAKHKIRQVLEVYSRACHGAP